MLNKCVLLVALAVVHICLLVIPLNVLAQSNSGENSGSKQIILRKWVNGATFGMRGQELPISKAKADGEALPALQEKRWKIVSIHMTGSAGLDPKQQAALVLLEKP